MNFSAKSMRANQQAKREIRQIANAEKLNAKRLELNKQGIREEQADYALTETLTNILKG